jgi:uncharacterized lipoprotein YddW (UPF0748 family)
MTHSSLIRALLAFSVSLGAATAAEYRAFWVDGFNRGFKTPSDVEQLVEDMRTARANAIFMQARVRGNSYYLNTLEPLADDPAWPPSFDALQYLIERAHAHGIEVHAWITVTPMWLSTTPPRDPKHIWNLHGPNAEGEANWTTSSERGVTINYLDPGHPGAFRHVADVALHLVSHYDIDGIHLDYIRYPEPQNGSGQFGYNPTAIARFNRLHNREGTPRSNDPEFSNFRRRQVTQLVRQIYLRTMEVKPKVKVSGALIAWGDGPANDSQYRQKDAYASVFQDWRSWIEEGILDLAMPMNYFADSRNSGFFNRWIEYEKPRQFSRKILIGMGNYLNSIAESESQIQRALAPAATGESAAGIAVYSYANTNLIANGRTVQPNADFYQMMANRLGEFQPAPALSWKEKPEKGHVLGVLQVDGEPQLADGVAIRIESDTGAEFRLDTITDGTGFFGGVDLPPDRYRVLVMRRGQEIYRSVPAEAPAGKTLRFDIQLNAPDLTGVIE